MTEREHILTHISNKIASLRNRSVMDDVEARCAQLFEALHGEIENDLHLPVDAAE